MYKIWIKSINFPKFDCVIAISLSISLTNTVAYTVKVNRRVSQAFTIKHSCQIQSVKPFLGRQFWHKLHRMHFGASQNCRPNPNALAARASVTGTSPIWEHHPPHPSKEIDTPDAMTSQRQSQQNPLLSFHQAQRHNLSLLHYIN